MTPAARKSTSWMGDPEDDDEDEEEEKKEQEEDEDEEENDGEEEEVPWQVAGNGWLDPIKKPRRSGVSKAGQVRGIRRFSGWLPRPCRSCRSASRTRLSGSRSAC